MSGLGIVLIPFGVLLMIAILYVLSLAAKALNIYIKKNNE